MNGGIQQYVLGNAAGMIVKIINYGGAITNILTPDARGRMDDVVLGFDTPGEYTQRENPFFGCITGRYANRISKGRFAINGKTYQLAVTNDGYTLHGGDNGFNRKIWNAAYSGNVLKLSYLSADGEEGFPGNLSCEVIYTLTDLNELHIAYTAASDAPTFINLTNHSYFNLAGGGTIESHQMQIHAGKFVEVGENYIPTGQLKTVDESPMDFRRPKPIGRDLGDVKGGFDHTWVLDKTSAGKPELACALCDPHSGRCLEVFTTQPGMQFYTGNFLDGTLRGKKGVHYPRHAGLCLETQHFPDSPNQPLFPDTLLRPGEVFRQTTIYRFSVK